MTPVGATYVGRGTVFGNPFYGRPRIGHARGVILFDAWLQDGLTHHILSCAGFDDCEIDSLGRLRQRLIPSLPQLRGRDLQCWCPLTSAWCHADTLLRIVNGGRS